MDFVRSLGTRASAPSPPVVFEASLAAQLGPCEWPFRASAYLCPCALELIPPTPAPCPPLSLSLSGEPLHAGGLSSDSWEACQLPSSNHMILPSALEKSRAQSRWLPPSPSQAEAGRPRDWAAQHCRALQSCNCGGWYFSKCFMEVSFTYCTIQFCKFTELWSHHHSLI